MPTELIEQISAVEERLRLAMLASECKTLDELISPDLIFTNHFGQVLGKQDDLEMHRRGVLKLLKLAPSESQVKASGGVAVVSVRMQVAGSYAGSAFDEDLRYTRVWGRSVRGTWQILAGHSSRVAVL
ncbi:MAG: nuclear transport factor 2 family protein [Massilia sp.]